MGKTLFIFIDESGNFDFSDTGTRHYVLAAMATADPTISANALQRLKYDYLREGIDVKLFHASEDKQLTRNRVLRAINDMDSILSAYYIYTIKEHTAVDMRTPRVFYAKLGIILVENIIKEWSDKFEKVVVVFDECLRKKDQQAFLDKAKPRLKKLRKPYSIYFHRTLSDFNGQIADYFAWAKYVSLERGEYRPLLALQRITTVEIKIDIK